MEYFQSAPVDAVRAMFPLVQAIVKTRVPKATQARKPRKASKPEAQPISAA